ncbi:MAG: hypothetical protein ABI540_01890 [Spartobacteria bacterium]
MKYLLLCALLLGTASCTTLSNRRDLYNPSENVGFYNVLQQKKVTMRTAPSEEPSLPSQ